MREDNVIVGVILFVAIGFVTWAILEWNVLVSLFLASLVSGIAVYLIGKK